ncbi:MAG: hypothetical protein HFJ34_04790 [Clostridia bacterium]|nr:hypothetical protein [Clostridia bacterium]
MKKVLNYPIKIINGKQFYIAEGAKSNHFLTDSEFKTRNENFDMVKKKFNQMIEEVCK